MLPLWLAAQTPIIDAARAQQTISPVIAVFQEDGKLLDSSGFFNGVEVARKFYATHTDAFDYLITFGVKGRVATEAFIRAKVDAKGIGDVDGLGKNQLGDFTAQFGSRGRLRGVISMNGLRHWEYDLEKNNRLFQAMTHELAHSWLSYINELPGKPGVQLSFGPHFYDALSTSDECEGTFTGVQMDRDSSGGGNQWIFRQYGAVTDCLQKFHPLGLYLMGMLDPSEIEGQFYKLLGGVRYLGQGSPKIVDGKVAYQTERYSADAEADINVGDLIAAAGPRIPDAAHSQREFTVAYAVVVEPGEVFTQADQQKLLRIAEKFQVKWNEATRARSRIIDAVGPIASRAACHDNQVYGDIDGNGSVTQEDAALLGRIAAGLEPAPSKICCLDLNDSGNVSLVDWVIARRVADTGQLPPGAQRTLCRN